ncbi:TonB-dependent receptor [Parahaliea maris]|nr:TonB-dependent receptor [Parahaliea maris]
MKKTLLAAALLSTVVPAWAQELEEVVVIAQKRESNLQETPIAITVMSESFIQTNRIEDFRDISAYTPNMVFSSSQGFSLIALRGVGLNISNLAGEAAVAMYVDGVYNGQTFLYGVPDFDLKRIEVLRGPQGTLYGRNSTGGAVNIITRKPSFDPELDIAATVEEYERYRLDAGGSLPLTDTIALRGSVVADKQEEGYRDNPVLGTDQDKGDVYSTRLSALWQPVDTVEVQWAADYLNEDRSSYVLESLASAPNAAFISPSNVGGFLVLPNPALGGLSLADLFGLEFPVVGTSAEYDPDDKTWYSNESSNQEVESYGSSLTISWAGEGLGFKSITGYRDASLDRRSDNDGTDLTLLHLSAYQEAQQFTQEFNLTGESFDDRLEWIVGAFYFDEDARADFFFDLDDFQTTYEALFGLPAGAPLPPGSFLAFGPRLKTGEGSPYPFLDFSMKQSSESVAAFTQLDYAISEHWSVSGGLRYTVDKKQVNRSLTGNIAGGILCMNDRESETWEEGTGMLGVEYALSDTAMLFAKASSGYKAGGFNPGECSGSFDPETLLAYEVGAKTRLLGNSLQLNVAAFSYDYEDIQVNRYINNSASIANAAKADVYGIEAEFVYAPTAGLQLDGGFGFLDSEYGEAYFSDPVLNDDPVNIEGNRLIRAPEWTAVLGVQYSWDTRAGLFVLRADTSYKSEYAFDVFEASLPNQQSLMQDAYTQSNLRLTWIKDHFSVQAFVENIEDEVYGESITAVGTTGSVVGSFSRPRVFGGRLTYSM